MNGVNTVEAVVNLMKSFSDPLIWVGEKEGNGVSWDTVQRVAKMRYGVTYCLKCDSVTLEDYCEDCLKTSENYLRELME